MRMTPDEQLAFCKRKLAESRAEATELRRISRLYARQNERLCARFYEDERTIKQLRARHADD